MDRADATGIAGVVIGAGLTVAAVMFPWGISVLLRHILVWAGIIFAALGGLWLLRVYFPKRSIRGSWAIH